ncbi:MAG TPA: right-handed parallel beta-helix repeat-containing protein [Verrucomicrobiae bacterium]|nr:right-handed parallel beta-helix repeat-containing protein [Verrucomicrobiae bacterium]
MKRIMLVVMAAAVAAGSPAAAPEQVARVVSGELKEARASWWGFEKEDATRALQAAIDSRVPRLIVDDTGAPWITDRLTLVSDQEIVFEKGVEVLAKKGAFTGKSDSLFSLVCVTNVTLRGPGATLRMRRADYDAAPYAKAEWRHVLNIRSSVNVKILGLTLAESGGDGVYLGCAKGGAPNVGIHIKDVVCDKNYRQGISVISAEDLLIENTVMRETAGTPPAAGIDFEPNHERERLKNCVMRDCLTVSNQGDGYDFYVPQLTGASEPLAIRIENCTSSGDRFAVRITTGNSPEQAVRGTMTFTGCRFENAQRSGVGIARKPASGASLAFERCVIAGCAAGAPGTPDIHLSNRVEDELPVGGIRLDRLMIMSPIERPWIAWQNNTTVVEPVADLEGTVTVEQAGIRREIALTPEWANKMFPPRFTVRVPRVAPDLANARVVDREEGIQKLSPLRLRRAGTYVFHAAAGREVVLVGQHSQVGRYAPATKPLLVRSPVGKVVQKVALPAFRGQAEIRFVPDVGGFYTLEVDAGANAFALLSANVPVALDVTKKAANLIASTGSLFVPVPPGTGVFAIGAAGEGDGEAVKVTVLDPSGAKVWTKDNITQIERFTATDGQGSSGGIWQVKLERPGAGAFEDFHVEALGVPGYLFLNRNRYW